MLNILCGLIVPRNSFFASEQKICNSFNKDLVSEYFLVVLPCRLFMVFG